MCLAEALLRIPDGETADRLIADKIPSGAWDEHLGDSESLLVNASTWGLMLTGRVVALDRNEVGEARSWYSRLVGKLGEPVARAALKQAMRILGHQFVMGRDIESALERARRQGRTRLSLLLRHARRGGTHARGCRALSREVFGRHCGRRARAVETRESITARHSISIKLSALHPRYEFAQTARVMTRALSGHRETRARGARRRHRRDPRRRRGRAAGDVAAAGRQAARKRGHARLCGFRPRRAGLSEARVCDARMAGAQAARHGSAHHAASREGRVLGQRDQARAGTRPRRLSGLHAQAEYRCFLPGVRASARERRRAHLSAVRDPQRAHHRARRGIVRRRCEPLRVPATARHGRRALRQRGARVPGDSSTRAACTRRWARTKTCCPTWSGACSRTAPILRS